MAEKITLDGFRSSHHALRLLRREDPKWKFVRVRTSQYLDNLVEQDHRAIKRRCAWMTGFSVVAREAGISAANIHNTYPAIAQTIRTKSGDADRHALDSERTRRKLLTERLRTIQERLRAAEENVVRIASENARLVSQNTDLRAKLAARNIVEFATTGRRSRRRLRAVA